MISRQLVDGKITERLLQLFENGDKYVKQLRDERFVLRTKKLGHTISKRSLPRMGMKPNQSDLVTPTVITKKTLASAQRDIDTAKERGMPLRMIYSHDFLPSSSLFEGKLPKKTSKSQLVSELQDLSDLKPEDLMAPQCRNITVLLDFMSRARTIQAKNCETVGDLITSAILSIFERFNTNTFHIIRDSYLEASLKSCERLVRADGIDPIMFQNFSSDLTLPDDMNQFWAHQPNKEQLQDCIPAVVNGLQELINTDIVVSGRIYDDGEQTPALLIPAGRNPVVPNFEPIPTLKSAIEEADDRIFPHLMHEVLKGNENFLLVSNDTDTVARALYHIVYLKSKGLKLLWIQFGTGDNLRYLPIHEMHNSLRDDFSKAVLKAHILTEDDMLSKIGTKHAALVTDPVKYLSGFAEGEEICHAEMWLAEEYLVKVWAGARTKVISRSFDLLRLAEYTNSKEAKPLESLPPTSSSVNLHLKRAHHVIRNVASLLSEYTARDPKLSGWYLENGVLLPDMNLKPLPNDIKVHCKCQGKCSNKRCPCQKEGQACTLFCHANSNPQCENK